MKTEDNMMKESGDRISVTGDECDILFQYRFRKANEEDLIEAIDRLNV